MSDARHERFEELISASLTGDLSDLEQRRLSEHLAECETCRATHAAFREQRRFVAGLRHLPPPRNLSYRVHSGIDTGAHAPLPFWRRPAAAVIGLAGAGALAAGVLLGAMLLDVANPDGVGTSLPPSASAAVASPSAAVSPSPDGTPIATPEPTPLATPTIPPEPDAFLAVTGPADNQVLTTHDGATGETTSELPSAAGPPIAAALSPDGEWLAYVARGALSNMVEVWVARTTSAEAHVLGSGVGGSAFLEQLSWSPDGRYLAYALAYESPLEGARTDAWVADTDGADGPVLMKLTLGANGVVGSFDANGALWVSVATERPTSYRLAPDIVATQREMSPETLASAADAALPGWFQPLLSPDGGKAIAWRGEIDMAGDPWFFARGGEPVLVDATQLASGAIDGGVPVFADLSRGPDGFRSVAIAWGPDSNAIAAWDAVWTSSTGGPDGQVYPDRLRVYLGRASEPQPINSTRALDAADLPEGIAGVVDVAVAPDGRHLAITVLYPTAGDLAPPEADLLLIKRNTGTTPDEPVALPGVVGEGWYGPAVYDPGR
jgi:Putative zinc-finger/WD40-like Beta Propeller Repeat